MRLFLTGGTGFVGSHFLQQALDAGHTVIAQRRPGSQPRLPMWREPEWIDRPMDGDFSAELAKCDAVVHLAAHTPNPPYAALDECLYWNLLTPVRLIQQAAAQGVTDVLVAGTCFEYGSAADGQQLVHPATEVRPALAYPISKAAATTSLLGLARDSRLRLQVLRIFQVYGEGEASTRFWPSLRRAALNGQDFPMSSGLQVRDFVPVEQVARDFVNALDFSICDPGRPRVRNVGTGQAQSLLEFAQQLWVDWGAVGKLQVGQMGLRPGELARLVANVHAVHIA